MKVEKYPRLRIFRKVILTLFISLIVILSFPTFLAGSHEVISPLILGLIGAASIHGLFTDKKPGITLLVLSLWTAIFLLFIGHIFSGSLSAYYLAFSYMIMPKINHAGDCLPIYWLIFILYSVIELTVLRNKPLSKPWKVMSALTLCFALAVGIMGICMSISGRPSTDFLKVQN